MSTSADSDLLAALRQQMVDRDLRGRGISDQRVLQAMQNLPREKFVPEKYRAHAYEDRPLPIGEGQTISQPYMVAIMLQALALQPTDTVLEVGTGSGYVTALLAVLAARVVSIERVGWLAAGATQVLTSLGYQNVSVITGDGSEGFPASAPYDAILVSAATAAVPHNLLLQLRENDGRMVIPVGPPEAQQLEFIRRIGERAVVTPCGGCRFVPLVPGVSELTQP